MIRTSAPLTAALAAALTLPAVAADPVGPPIGNNRYKAHIEDGPQGDDVDDYVVALFAGERIAAKVKAPFQSPLFPVLRLLDPDGNDRSADAGLPPQPLVKKVRLAPFTVDETGLWAVRVEGQRESEGPYTIRFSVKTPGKQRQKRVGIGGTLPAAMEHAFEAVDGATLDVTVKTRGRGAVARPVTLRGPDGTNVSGPEGGAFADAVQVRKRSAKIKRLRLANGSGTYVLTIDAGGDAAEYDLTYRVRAPSRPKRGAKLVKEEPFLPALAEGPIRGVAGTRVRLHGWNFSVDALPTVRFGRRLGAEVLVDPSGGFLDVTAPQPEALGPVPVSVANPDGQGSVQDDHFHYVEPPVLHDLTDLLGVPVRGGSVDGGRRVRLVGEDFQTGQLVRFGRQGTATIPFLHSDTVMDVTVPPGAAGFVNVIVFDTFDQEAESEFVYEYKEPPVFDPAPYTPALLPPDTATLVVVRGDLFALDDFVTFDGAPVTASPGGPQVFSFTAPPRGDGTYVVAVQDRHGVRVEGPGLRVKAAGIIDSVTAVGGPRLSRQEISRHGGTTVRIAGSRFHAGDTVTVGGAAATVTSAVPEEIVVTTPSGAPGLADVVVTDLLGTSTTATGALRYAGAADATADRAPGGSTADDLSGVRGVAGDLDGDGDADDLALLSDGTSPGTRAERLRVLLGNAQGALVDDTADALPAAGTDSTGTDDWRGAALGLGDVDGGDGPDLLVAGSWPDPDEVSELRLLTNDGYGVFALQEDDAPDSLYRPALVAEDELDQPHTVYAARQVDGVPTCLALGDVDGDGDLDVVLGRDRPLSVDYSIDPDAVDLGSVPPYISSADAVTYAIDETRYSPGTRVLENRIGTGDGFVDVTAAALPSAGKDVDATPSPALVARDLALADLDGDDDLDLVVTWDDPTTVTPKGLSGTDTARVATRVLVNDGDGVFTDATSSWLPAASAPEWFQADRLFLVDLDDDDDADLVLVHAVSLNQYLGIPPGGNRRALRVLRNDGDPAGAGSGFTDVSANALPRVPIAGNDNLRGDALTVGDVTGDGVPDILVGARTAPTDGGTGLRALRLLVGTAGSIAFAEASAFLTPLAVDSGQCDDVLLVHDLAGNATPSIVLIAESAPTTSPAGERLRIADWER